MFTTKTRRSVTSSRRSSRWHSSDRSGENQPTGPAAKLAAGLLLATGSVAFLQAHRTFRQGRDQAAANGAFLTIVDQGTVGRKAAMAVTPYA